MKNPALKGLIHPTIAGCPPEEIEPHYLPFVQLKVKKNQKTLSYWKNDSTSNNYVAHTATGRAYAIELMQYLVMRPDSRYLFSKVMKSLCKKEKSPVLMHSFVDCIAELAIEGANARIQGIHVEDWKKSE